MLCDCDSWGSECAAGGFVLCVWDSWVSECAASGFVLCVGQLVVGVGQVGLCSVFGTVG